MRVAANSPGSRRGWPPGAEQGDKQPRSAALGWLRRTGRRAVPRSAQARLTELLARNAQHQLEATEVSELDRLLERVDQLTVLKTRARYTLQHYQAGASPA